MDDFASSALFNLIAAALKRQGLRVSSGPAFTGKTTSDSKLDLLRLATQHLGFAGILTIGQGIKAVPADPILAILLKATEPFDLLERWQRLERYFHGRHRTRTVERGAHSVVVEHFSTTGRAPSVQEDILIAGLLAALFQMIGVRALRLCIGDQTAIENGTFSAALSAPDRSFRWQFRWQSIDPNTQPSPEGACTQSVTARVTKLINGDLGRSWRLADVARDLGMSTRTLQRNLAQDGKQFQTLLRTLRAQGAASLLRQSAYPLAAVGFAVGYADQAHFSRDFKLRFNMSPLQYTELATT